MRKVPSVGTEVAQPRSASYRVGGTLNAPPVLPLLECLLTAAPAFKLLLEKVERWIFLKDKIAQSICVSKKLKLKPNKQAYISGGV